jgi:2-oxoglutarate dehydrogenase E2 component (dihydrolipoamide succinyltransferase)
MPIINQPQLGILSLGAIKKRAVVVNDAIAIRDTIIVTFAYDHRVIDGALAGHFLSFITKHLENWNSERSV